MFFSKRHERSPSKDSTYNNIAHESNQINVYDLLIYIPIKYYLYFKF